MVILPSSIHPIVPLILLFIVAVSLSSSFVHDSSPDPTPWPENFHSILVVNKSGTNQIIDLWYDWPNGRNFNIIRSQLGGLLYDLEWNNGTSFYYNYDLPSPTCRTESFEVGILRSNWLDGATYLGQKTLDGFICHVWTKADFIWYYEDVQSHKPVYWLFYTGMAVHVMTFEVGAALDDSNWQAPAYCFDQAPTAEINTTKSHLQEQAPTASAILKISGAVRL